MCANAEMVEWGVSAIDLRVQEKQAFYTNRRTEPHTEITNKQISYPRF